MVVTIITTIYPKACILSRWFIIACFLSFEGGLICSEFEKEIVQKNNKLPIPVSVEHQNNLVFLHGINPAINDDHAKIYHRRI